MELINSRRDKALPRYLSSSNEIYGAGSGLNLTRLLAKGAP